MSRAPEYRRSFDFKQHSEDNPSTPQPGASLNDEYDGLRNTTDGILANLLVIQRDDDQLANKIVSPESLSEEVLAMIMAGWTPRGDWMPATDYVVGDYVLQDGSGYVCVVAHTSTTFADDFNAGYWSLVFSAGIADRHVIVIRGQSLPDKQRLHFYEGFQGQDGTGETLVAPDWGRANTQVPRGDHDHDADYALINHGHSLFSRTAPGFTPSPGAGTGNNDRVLREDGSWASLLVSGGLPVGAVVPMLFDTPGTGWLALNGQSVLKADWPELDDKLSGMGYPWGSTADSFTLPDMAGRVVQHLGQGIETLWTFAQEAGQERVSLDDAQMKRQTGNVTGTPGGANNLLTDPAATDTVSTLGPRLTLSYQVKASSFAEGSQGISGEVNDGSNTTGPGAGVYQQKADSTLFFRTLYSSDLSVTITEEADAINLTTAGSGTVTDGRNLGVVGEVVYAGNNAGVLEFNRLRPGDNISMVSQNGEITINSAAGGDVTGPNGALDNAVAVYDLNTGKVLKDVGLIYTTIARNDLDNRFSAQQTVTTATDAIIEVETTTAPADQRRYQVKRTVTRTSFGYVNDDGSQDTARGELYHDHVDGSLIVQRPSQALAAMGAGSVNAEALYVNGEPVVTADQNQPGIIVSATPPADPTPGLGWYQSTTGRLAVWYEDANSGQWVESGPGAIGSIQPITTIVNQDCNGENWIDWDIEAGYDYEIIGENLAAGAEMTAYLDLSFDGGTNWTDGADWRQGGLYSRDPAGGDPGAAANPYSNNVRLAPINVQSAASNPIIGASFYTSMFGAGEPAATSVFQRTQNRGDDGLWRHVQITGISLSLEVANKARLVTTQTMTRGVLRVKRIAR